MLNVYNMFNLGSGGFKYSDDLFGRGDFDCEEILNYKESERDLVIIFIPAAQIADCLADLSFFSGNFAARSSRLGLNVSF